MDTAKLPILVTLMLAVIGWSVSHIVDRITTAPTIEYHVKTDVRDGKSIFILRLTNLSRDRAFRNMELQLQAPAGGKISSLNIIPVQPAFEGDEPTHVLESGDAWFNFAELQPGSTFYARAIYVGGDPKVKIKLKDESARIMEVSLETFLARWETFIFVGLIVSGILFILSYFICRSLHEKQQPTESPTIRITYIVM